MLCDTLLVQEASLSLKETCCAANPLKGLFKQTAGPHPSYTDWVGLGWDQKICILKSSQVILLLVVLGPHFEEKTALKTAIFFFFFVRRNNLATVSLQEKKIAIW